jgi:large subunit ribosomal protein L23
MIAESVLQAIVAPHVSEKATLLADKVNQHVFKVRVDADKSTIRKAVETLFGVKVAEVRVANVKGKTKRTGRFRGKRNDWKKAYVTLMPGHDIKLGEPLTE